MTTSDPLREGKGSPYEGGIRVPLIMRWTNKIKAGTVNDVPVHTVDYYPTFVAASGAAMPKHSLDGENLLPLLTGKGKLKRDTLYWHMPTYTVMYARTPCAVIRRGDWKLIHWFGDYLDTTGLTPDDVLYGKLLKGARTERYNLRDDLSERHDLMQKNPRKAAELKRQLEAWWKDTGAVFPEKNTVYNAENWWKDK